MEICIPKVSNTITRQKIFHTFCSLNIGYIARITENPLRSDPNSKRVIIKINWNNEPLAENIQEVLKNPDAHMNLVYDMPWYWQIYANQRQK